MSSANVSDFSKYIIDWKFFNALPIPQAAEVLGIELDERGKFTCPAHNDKNPSAQVLMKSPGQCKWKCWSCGAGGSAVNLAAYSLGVSAVEGIMYLAEFFPEGLTAKKVNGNIERPFISMEQLKEIGLSSNPYLSVSFNIPKEYAKDPNSMAMQTMRAKFTTELDATELILQKIAETQVSMRARAESIIAEFPGMDDDAKKVIHETTEEKIRALDKIKRAFSDYELLLSEHGPQLEGQFSDADKNELEALIERIDPKEQGDEMER